ncbi:MAG: IscS subfamily cysteine desulfurase [Alphaproteobacteria bacterium]|nr:IscS subfamily cysteine desulfurase [Alphaproteobacteria bacterium]MDA8030106.1 IscS subfamily cysteine desulfurase [Alphaproteobacteria bacterium]
MKPPLYFDYAATTPADPRVVKKMTRFLAPGGVFGNPASRTHALGQEAERAVEDARAQVAALIGANPLEIVWTSGATESNNLAIKGAARCNREKGGHLVTVQTEHKAVLDPMRELEREGFEITLLAPNSAGLIDPAEFAAALRADTVLASVMWVNNEIGVIQPVAELGKICRERDVIFHVDAAQAPGKVRIDVNAAGVDLLSLSAHKAYGPKGIGALYVRRKPRVQLEAQIHGGGHERGLRSGTLPTHQIAGMGEAFHLAHEEFDAENARIRGLRDKLLDCVRGIEETRINGDLENRVPHNINVSFGFVESESLILALPDVAVSTGSACTSASVEPSHVLQALGGGDDWAHSSIRFSLGRFTTEEEINFLTELLPARIAEMRALSPLWRKQAARAAGA